MAVHEHVVKQLQLVCRWRRRAGRLGLGQPAPRGRAGAADGAARRPVTAAAAAADAGAGWKAATTAAIVACAAHAVAAGAAELVVAASGPAAAEAGAAGGEAVAGAAVRLQPRCRQWEVQEEPIAPGVVGRVWQVTW